MPYLWEGTSSVTQHQGPVGSGKLVGVLFLGAGPLTGTLGKYWGREEGRKTCFTGRIFQLQHDQWFCLKNFVMGVGVTCGNSKPFSCYFQKLKLLHFSILSFSSLWERRLSLLCSHWEYSKCILLFGCFILVGFFYIKNTGRKVTSIYFSLKPTYDIFLFDQLFPSSCFSLCCGCGLGCCKALLLSPTYSYSTLFFIPGLTVTYHLFSLTLSRQANLTSSRP